MQNINNISVVLPSLDPDEKLNAVIDGLLQYGFTDIILVNDGSKAENLHYFEDAAAAHPEIHLLHHKVNKGKGAALKYAFSWFLENRPEGQGVVTVDGDNQHHPEDTRACCEQMLQSGHVVLGCRDFSQADVPGRSRFGNRTTSLIFKLFCGMTLSDTQTGLRAIPRKYLELFTAVKGDRFEYETNMLLSMKDNGIPYDERKIRTVYIEENKSSHFRVIRDSWRIYRLILAHFFKYTLSSIVSFFIDNGALTLFDLLFLHFGVLSGFEYRAVVLSICARAVSSPINFFMNQRMVFKTKVSTGKAFCRYYMLAIPQMIAQGLLTYGATILFDIQEGQTGLFVLVYDLVMIFLFLMSYMIQQRWVFAVKNSD